MENRPEVPDHSLLDALGRLPLSALWSRDREGHLFTVVPNIPSHLAQIVRGDAHPVIEVRPFPKDQPTKFRRVTLLHDVKGFKPIHFSENVRARQLAVCNAEIYLDDVTSYTIVHKVGKLPKPVTEKYPFVNMIMPAAIANAFCEKLDERIKSVLSEESTPQWSIPEMRLVTAEEARKVGSHAETVAFRHSNSLNKQDVNIQIPVCILPAFFSAGALNYFVVRNIPIAAELKKYGLPDLDDEGVKKACIKKTCLKKYRQPEQLNLWADRSVSSPGTSKANR